MSKPMPDAKAGKLAKDALTHYETGFNAAMELIRARYPEDTETRDALVAAHRALRHLRLRVEAPDGTE